MAIDTSARRITFRTIDGEKTSLGDFGDRTLLVVNVASRCGNTPQYSKLEELQKQYGDQGLTVIGFPCNQFLGQEPGSADDIKEFCSTTYGVTFPLMDKTRVNGIRKHPLYAALTREPDSDGKAGNVKWNFEKFVISPDGEVSRFRPKVQPDAPEVIAAIERGLSRAKVAPSSETSAPN
ncbi:MAG: glutathione peroxidase [Pseudolysinimonas sp.]|jgi:glutathione peroxidase|uniref:glutathione peroxidase n=1 Tax=Pseudolysinimonas sp. TaxID=2680009 RepID=UPI003C751214